MKTKECLKELYDNGQLQFHSTKKGDTVLIQTESEYIEPTPVFIEVLPHWYRDFDDNVCIELLNQRIESGEVILKGGL